MIEIGGRPILWHIMKIYAHFGLTEFIICLGYRGTMIKQYFAEHRLRTSDITVDLTDFSIEYHSSAAEPWRVTLVDTGETTLTGGRIKRIREFLPEDRPFCLAYGDGVGDVDIAAQLSFHNAHGLSGTMTVVRPPARYGSAHVVDGLVTRFDEKAQAESGLISGGFFVLEPRVLDAIDGDDTPFEREPLERLAKDGQLAAWLHDGFWQPMDTLREKELLERYWTEGRAPWKVWE